MIKIKRIYESPAEDDGVRIFVDRLWARGLTKEKAKLDFWEKEIAPSTELRKWYAHDEAKFEEFKKKYFCELDENPDSKNFLKKICDYEAENKNITLLFSAKDGGHSNAKVLAEWIEARKKMR